MTHHVNTANGHIIANAGSVDTNQISLRSAVIAANATTNATISLGAGTYQLTIPGDNNDRQFVSFDPTIGDLNVNASGTTIQGAGAASTTIQQTTGADRVIVVNATDAANVVFTLSGVTVTGGRETENGGNIGAGAIFTGGPSNTTNITNCVFLNNRILQGTSSGSLGGGALATTGGDLNVTGCTFGGTNASDPNVSITSGGAISYDSSDFVHNSLTGTLTVQNSTFINNQANGGGGGGGAITISDSNLSTATANISGCTFTGNQSAVGGGAIIAQSGTLNVTASTFLNNHANSSGGAIYGSGVANSVHFSRFIGNTSVNPSLGNALNAQAATLNGNDNWWGLNTGPATNDVTSNVTHTTWLRFTHTASATTINTPGGPAPHATTLTASFLTDSAGTAVSTSNLSTIIGLPISFSGATLGTLSNAQTTVQSNGTATATFTAGATGGNGGANATVDNAVLMAPVTVDQPPTINSANATTLTTGVAGSFNVTAAGFPAPTFSKTGTLPSSVTLSSAGLLSGTPAAHTGGTYPITITATNGVPPDSVQNFTLTVDEPPAFTSANSTTFTASVAGATFQLTSSGFPTTFTFTNTGNSLPSGMSLSSGGLLSGTPAVGTGGTYNLTLKVSNGISPDATQSFTLTVNEAPSVTTQPNAVVKCAGQNASFTSAASGFPAPTIQWQVSVSNGPFNNVSGETTATLNLNGVTVSQNGNQYRALFTNVVTSTPSNAALLTVNALPSTPTITPNPTAVDANSVGNQASGPAGATTYTWTVFNGTLTSANNIQAITYNASTGGNVHLGLTVTNASGCSATTNLDVPTKPIIISVTKPGNVPTIVFTALLGRTYTVERKDDLLAVGWTAVTNASNLAGNGSTLTVPDPDPGAGSLPKRFYHVVLLP